MRFQHFLHLEMCGHSNNSGGIHSFRLIKVLKKIFDIFLTSLSASIALRWNLKSAWNIFAISVLFTLATVI